MAGFNNPVVGGLEKLIREAIQSPNYVPGSTGWTINRDGSVEFNNGIFRGTLQAGTLIAGLITNSAISNSSFGDGNILNSKIAQSDIVIDSSGGTLLIYSVSGQTVTDLSIAGAGVFAVPAGVTFMKVEAIGSGGGGQGCYAAGGVTAYGASGSGGEYAREDHYVVTPLANIPYFIPDGGAGGPGSTTNNFATIGTNGASATFDTTGVVANGGLGGFGGTPRGGGSGSTNSIHFNGGSNSVANFGQAGAGGGGSGGSSSNGRPGNPAVSDTIAGAGATAVTGGGAGGGGGAVNTAGGAGVQPGGGGGGGGGQRPASVKAGGKGGAGRIRLTYGGAITLIASVAGVAGVDQYGNSYPAGIRTNISSAAGLSGGYYEELTIPVTALANNTTVNLKANATTKLISDYGSAYNMATGQWTAPADGLYTITVGTSLPAFGANGRLIIDLSSAALSAGTIYQRRAPEFIAAVGGAEENTTMTRFFNAGTTVFVSVNQNSGAALNTIATRNNTLTFSRSG